MTLSLVVAEAALELVPESLRRSPAVVNDARRRGVEPSAILLDRSFHHSAMQKLPEGFKRGRPDLVHTILLSATGSPSYLEGKVKVYVHTFGGTVLELTEGTRIPKSYLRFRGLAEKLLSDGGSDELVKVYRSDMKQLVRKIGPDFVCGLSTQGKTMTMKDMSALLSSKKEPCVVVGGFPHGHFSQETLKLMDELVRIHAKPLEAHVVTSRLLYEFENRLDERMND